jgi:lipopolysaccharide assembly protein A
MLRLATWVIRIFLFVALFGFAMNNRQPATVHGFFGVQWETSLVVALLVAFALGAALGVFAMLPGRLRARRAAASGTGGLQTPGALDAQDSRSGPTSVLPGAGRSNASIGPTGSAGSLRERGARAVEHPPRLT